MDINVKTKFNVGDFANREYFGGYHPIEILGIEIYVNKDRELEVCYNFKPYSDSWKMDTIREKQLFTDKEIEQKTL